MMFLSLLIYLLFPINSTHNSPVATYSLNVSDFEIDIEIEFHKSELQEALTTKHNNFNKQEVANYITSNTKWLINGNVQVLQYCEFYNDDYHYLIKAHLSADTPIKKIEIFNNCLISEIADHTNVVYIYQKNKEVRGFRSHKERQSLTIEL